jgi:hypothetical protein
MFCIADLSLAAENAQELTCHGGFWYDFRESQAASCIYFFQSQNHRFRMVEAD